MRSIALFSLQPFLPKGGETLDPIIGLVLLLNVTAAKKAVILSRKLTGKQVDPSLVLEDGKTSRAIAHLSMIHMVRPEDGTSRLREALRHRVRRFRGQVRGKFTGLGLRRNWAFWETPRTPELDNLHRTVITTARRFSTKPVPISWPMNETQQRMHQIYGYPACGECFDPHVTLSIFPPDAIDEKLVRESSVTCQWTSPALALVEIGPQGRAVKILHRITLL
ncbi:MAG: hypothetical protein Q8R07_04850 [Candidatus Uhrbacteria bacterium]|nr:hypothetical protein [Candidatus Uhrbacteria bacterium]